LMSTWSVPSDPPGAGARVGAGDAYRPPDEDPHAATAVRQTANVRPITAFRARFERLEQLGKQSSWGASNV
jgi:hypothetical protein